MKILAIYDEFVTACEFYRVIYPLQAIERLNVAPNKPYDVIMMTAQTMANRIARHIDDFIGTDLILFNRITIKQGQRSAWTTEILNAQARGTAVVCDYDDDLSNEHRKVTDGVLPDPRMWDALTVSTDQLKERFKGWNKYVYILPNAIDTKVLNADPQGIPFRRRLGGRTVGLTGSETHQEDWKPAVAALLKLLPDFPDVTLYVSGFMPDELRGHPQVAYPGLVYYEGDVPLLADGLRVPITHYGQILQDIDIGLCPVDPDDPFNHYKSNLKALELMLSKRPVFVHYNNKDKVMDGGAAVIATGGSLPIYKDAVNVLSGIRIDHHHDPHEWEIAVRGMLNALDVFQVAGHKHAQSWTIDKHTRHRIDVYSQIIERARKRTHYHPPPIRIEYLDRERKK